ncbi:DUF4129 domain-containing protein [Aldersonia sp. NBC_00410]|uniref:DUF4129 domain-containing protein n=1 Tax=Aldersonia sp. NBC_00410 TaxID=2975954 RepID=UPI00224EABD1|nr:DUF4129 domain-containing protein [Aldersonia sp. NBC_00410]MCX5043276.1 DUF4129 domain-containing protein [Aldersonia sp. NBC_00410]
MKSARRSTGRAGGAAVGDAMFSERRRAVGASGLALLLATVAIALGGTLPGYTPPRPHPSEGNGSLVAVAVLLILAVAILMAGLVVALRRGGGRDAPSGETRSWQLETNRPTARQVLILAGVAAVVLALFAALSMVRAALAPDPAQQTPVRNTDPDADEPAAEPAAERADEQARPDPPDVFDWVALGGATLVVLTIAGAGLVSARTGASLSNDRRESIVGPVPVDVDVSESLARAAELGLAEMSEPGRDPREAIIACYAAMETALADAPLVAPRASDTPSEVLARAVTHDALHTDAAGELVALFTEARFSPHRMGESHRESATRQLQSVLDDLRGRRP